MTLSTDIYIHGTGVTQREVYDKVNDLLGIPAERRIIDGPHDWDWQQGDYRLSNELGQGFPAIVDTWANADGSIVTPEHDDDCREWSREDGEPCKTPRHTVPPWHVHVDLDTAYGYRDERGWGCSQLHGWVIAALIDWLAEHDCTLHWVNEYAGTLHEGKDGLAGFIGDGDQADAWFRGEALPAIPRARRRGAPMSTRPHIVPAAGQSAPSMTVSYFDGEVTIALPPALARDLASIWAQAHVADPLLDQTRPDWHDDIVALISNAALADQHLAANPVQVPVLALPQRVDVPTGGPR